MGAGLPGLAITCLQEKILSPIVARFKKTFSSSVVKTSIGVPLFLLLLLTGVRPGELTHLLLPDDLDLAEGWLMATPQSKADSRHDEHRQR